MNSLESLLIPMRRPSNEEEIVYNAVWRYRQDITFAEKRLSESSENLKMVWSFVQSVRKMPLPHEIEYVKVGGELWIHKDDAHLLLHRARDHYDRMYLEWMETKRRYEARLADVYSEMAQGRRRL